MNLIFAQEAAPLPHSPEYPLLMTWLVLILVPALMIFIGTSRGFQALNDIRHSGGALGGAGRATVAAGLLPAALLIAACGAGLTFLAEEVMHRERREMDTWTTAGCVAGLGLAFLLMRRLYRHTTGWVRPARVPAETTSGLATTSVVLTIVGAALALFLLTVPSNRIFALMDYSREALLLFNLVILLGGLICGVLSRQESAGKTCAWISGVLFVFLLAIAFA